MDYWHKQTSDKPLYEDILWSRPESKSRAGKLLIIGGNAHAFSSVGEAYQGSVAAGAGVVRSLLPEALRKIVGSLLEGTDFAPSTPSGSFGREALQECLAHASWADSVLVAGDLGRNSETAILLESFVQKYSGSLTVTKDAVDYFYAQPELLADRPQTMIVLSMAQLQKLGTSLKFPTPFLLGMGLMLLAQALHEFTLKHDVIIVTKELDQIVVAYEGKVSSTKLKSDKEVWRAKAAAQASVFWMQNPNKPFEAITSSFAFSD